MNIERSGTAPAKQDQDDHPLVVVLTRGWNRRTDTDKAFLPFHGRPLIAHALSSLTSMTTRPLIITKRPEAYADLGVEVIRDHHPEETPMSGILTAGTVAAERGARWIVVTAADTVPLIDDLFLRLWNARRLPISTSTGDAAFAPPAAQPSPSSQPSPPAAVLAVVAGVIQPIPAVYHITAIRAWRAAYESGTYRLTPVAAALPAVRLPFSATPFLNINTTDRLDLNIERSGRCG